MRRLTRTAIVGAAALAVLLTACVPMQISPVLDRRATLVQGVGGAPDQLTVTGTISCTRSEPVDVFPDFTQNGLTELSGESSVACGPGEPQPWSLTFEVDPGFEPGRVGADVRFCTNPAEHIDEDCVSVSRGLDLVLAP